MGCKTTSYYLLCKSCFSGLAFHFGMRKGQNLLGLDINRGRKAHFNIVMTVIVAWDDRYVKQTFILSLFPVLSL